MRARVTTKPSEDLDETARFIAQALEETEAKPLSQITKVVEVLGRDESLDLLDEVDRIEANGGMLLPNGQRRRTPGGVFFYLARQRLPRPYRYSIFAPPPEKRESEPPPSSTRPRPRVIEVHTLLPRAKHRSPGHGQHSNKPYGNKGRLETRNLETPPRQEISQILPPPAPAPAKPTTKKEFVLSQPISTPASEIVAAAKRQGISISASYIYTVRQPIVAARSAIEEALLELPSSVRKQLLTDLLQAELAHH